MMTISDPISFYLLLISNAVLLAAASIAILRFQYLVRTSQQFWSSPTGASLKEQHAAPDEGKSKPAAVSSDALELRVAKLQKLVHDLEGNSQLQQATATSALPIENAARMARHGASVADIRKSCGLNIGEAQLMKKLHGQVAANG